MLGNVFCACPIGVSCLYDANLELVGDTGSTGEVVEE